VSHSRIKLSRRPASASGLQRALVVDDEPRNRKLLRALLEPLAVEVVMAESAEEALELVRGDADSIDVILLDRELPGIDGIELLRLLKQDVDRAHIPVIMQTAATTPAQVREGLRAGASYYLTKPIEAAELHAVVRSALRLARDEPSFEQPSALGSSCCFQLLMRAEFEFRTLSDARQLAHQLSLLCPDPGKAAFGLQELMVNAIEHGNLEISFEEKSKLCRSDSWHSEVERRLQLPAYRGRTASVQVTRLADKVTFVVRDQGPGFCWQTFLELEPARAFAPNGRGIALARGIAFSQLRYDEPGNIVTAEVRLGDAS
jgi:CheY-like chemotaxis protein/anti-sigma regulatory factor (Ser/Thr protein kinase)